MSISRDIRVLHLESTDVCQAACPSCARETDAAFDRHSQHHLTIEQIMHHISVADIKRLHKMFMCGNYGDPAAGKHTLEIYQWFRDINPKITLGMNTNGALQNEAWWRTLGALFNGLDDYVVFSIDGRQDTNHVYRSGVQWEKLIKNVTAYISTGASAHWDMLIYRHNEHQIAECENLARAMGFRWFRAKVSKRSLVAGLERPIGWQHPQLQGGAIQCHALREQSFYIDAHGRSSPCCWLGSRLNNFVTDFTAIQQSWYSDNPNPVCRQTCTQHAGRSVFDRQWQRETQLC